MGRPPVHGLYSHPLYGTWRQMIRRCTNSRHGSYRWYGGKGVSVYESWLDVTVFVTELESAIGPRPSGMSLDRIDTNGNYEPGNVKWSTSAQQARNRTSSKLTLDQVRALRASYSTGRVSQQTLADEYGVSQHTVSVIVRGKVWIEAT